MKKGTIIKITMMITAAALWSAILPSCSSETAPDRESAPRAIEFGTHEWAPSRATALATSTIASFGVCAGTADGDIIFDNQPVTGGNGSWAYTPKKFWPQSGSMAFQAYAPYATTTNGMSVAYEDADDDIELSYSLPSSPADQVDILFADRVSVADVTSHPAQVSFIFSHILSQICVKARYTADNPPEGTTVTIEEMAFGGRLIQSADYTAAAGWTNQVTMSSPYTYSWDGDDLAVALLSTAYQTVLPDAIGVYVIPGASAITLTLYIKYSVEVPGNAAETFEVSGDVPIILEAGKRYMLQADINVETGIQVSYSVSGLGAWDYPSEIDGPMEN